MKIALAGGCLLALTGLLAACGSSASGSGSSGAASYAKEAPASILDDAVKAMSAATSYQASGNLSINDAAAQITFAVKEPTSVSATIDQSGNVIKLVALPSASYIYANSAFWKSQGSGLSSSQLAALADKWYKAPATLASSLTRGLGDIKPQQLATCLKQTVNRATVTGSATVDGQSVVVLHFAGGKPGTAPGTMDVSTSSPHYPLALAQTGRPMSGGTGPCDDGPTDSDNGKGVLTFSKWNAVTITAPAGATKLP